MSLEIQFMTKERFRDIIPEPVPAAEMFPEWFSKIPLISKSKCPFAFVSEDLHQLSLLKDTNIKGCMGVVDYLR